MVICFSKGGLGNQLFQLSFVEYQFSKSKKYCFGFTELFHVFKVNDSNFKFFNINSKSFFFKLFSNFFYLSAKYRLFTSIYQNKEKVILDFYSFGNDIIRKRGLIPVTIILDGFFQSSKFISKSFSNKFDLKTTEKIIDINSYIVCHFRRGDYRNWEILGSKNQCLPLSYYKKSVSLFSIKKILIIGDEIGSLKTELFENDIFRKYEVFFLNTSVIDSLNILRDAKYLVISNSSFAFWGAMLNKNAELVIYPKYWLGWKVKNWYPTSIQNSFDNIKFKYIEI